MLLRFRQILFFLLLFPLFACSAANNEVTESTLSPARLTVLKNKINALLAMDRTEVKSLEATPIPSLYEVVTENNDLFYVSADGRYLVSGVILDMEKQTNLTQNRMDALHVIDFAALPLDKAIKEVRGNGKDIVVAFSDPDCPFCKRLEHELAKIDNVTIYNFLMPLDSLHPQARRKAVNIWCSSNRTQAWTDWMRHNKMPDDIKGGCDNPVGETVQLGMRLGFTGTPVVIFPNGQVQMGFSPKEALEAAIRANQ